MSLTFSNAHLWTKCASACSPHNGETGQRTPSSIQLEGRAAAWLANVVLRDDLDPAEFIGEYDPSGTPIDEEMASHIAEYVGIVTHHGPVVSEASCTLYDGIVNGRPDAVTIDDGDSPLLRVYELKYGYRVVEAFENEQLLLAAMAYARDCHETFQLCVYQPRVHHPRGTLRKWTINRQELDDYYRRFGELAVRAERADKSTPATPGPQCGKCNRAGTCSALAQAVYASFEIADVPQQSARMTAVELGAEMRFLQRAEQLLAARRAGIQTEAELRMLDGEFVPGQQLSHEYAHRTFTAAPEIVELLTGVKVMKEVMKSPAEVQQEGKVKKEVMDVIAGAPFRGVAVKPYNEKAVGALFSK